MEGDPVVSLLTQRGNSPTLKQIGKRQRHTFKSQEVTPCLERSQFKRRSSRCSIVATTLRCPERRLAGGSVSIHELPTFLSCAAERLTPAIKMWQSLRQSAAWMVLFTS